MRKRVFVYRFNSVKKKKTNLSFVPVFRDSVNSGSCPLVSGYSSDFRPLAVLQFVCFVTSNILESFFERQLLVYLRKIERISKTYSISSLFFRLQHSQDIVNSPLVNTVSSCFDDAAPLFDTINEEFSSLFTLM